MGAKRVRLLSASPIWCGRENSLKVFPKIGGQAAQGPPIADTWLLDRHSTNGCLQRDQVFEAGEEVDRRGTRQEIVEPVVSVFTRAARFTADTIELITRQCQVLRLVVSVLTGPVWPR